MGVVIDQYIEQMNNFTAALALNEGDGVRAKSRIEKRLAADPNYAETVLENLKLVEKIWKGNTGHARPMSILSEALTDSDFSAVFADFMDKKLIGKYSSYSQDWRKYIQVKTTDSFKEAQRVKTWGASQDGLAKVGPGGEYQTAEAGDASYTTQVYKYGRKYDITWEMIVNDQLDALRTLPLMMAKHANVSLAKAVTALFDANNTLYNASQSPGGLNTNTYANTGSTALSVAAISAVLTLMHQFRDENGDPFDFVPKYLVVGSGLIESAKQFTTAVPATAVADINTVAGLEAVLNPYIGSSTAWYIFAEQDEMEYAVEATFLEGHEEPQLFMKAGNQIAMGGGDSSPGVSYENETRSYKVRSIWGGAAATAVNGWAKTFRGNS